MVKDFGYSNRATWTLATTSRLIYMRIRRSGRGPFIYFRLNIGLSDLYLTAEIVTVTKEQKQKYPIDCQQPQKIAP